MFDFGIKRVTSHWDHDLKRRELTLYFRDGQKMRAHRKADYRGGWQPQWILTRVR